MHRSFAAPVILALLLWHGLHAEPAATAETPVRLTILGDNSVARPEVKAVWGFACLVEAHGHTVLFDTGADPAVLKDNLAALNLDPAKIEAVVISHYHDDHTRGAPGLGPRSGVRAYLPEDFTRHTEESGPLHTAGLVFTTVTAPTPLFDGISIASPLPFAESDSPDPAAEQCLTIDTPEGLVVLVGCSHPGIVALLEQVKRATGRPLYFVIGGFHLFAQSDAEVLQIATALRELGVANVSATHCTGPAAAAVFRQVFGAHYLATGVGARIDLPLASGKP